MNHKRASWVAQTVKNLPAMQETLRFLSFFFFFFIPQLGRSPREGNGQQGRVGETGDWD